MWTLPHVNNNIMGSSYLGNQIPSNLLSAGNPIVSLFPIFLVSCRRYFTPVTERVGSVVKTFRLCRFDLEEWQSIYSSKESRNELPQHWTRIHSHCLWWNNCCSTLLAAAKCLTKDILFSYWATAECFSEVRHLLLRFKKLQLMRSSMWEWLLT